MRDPVTDLDDQLPRAACGCSKPAARSVPTARSSSPATRQIYGRPDYLPVDEKHPLRPVDVNGVNKMAGEAYHLLYHDVYGITATALRLTNTYGPRMRIKDARQTFLGIWLRARARGRAVRGVGRRAAPRLYLCRRRGRGVLARGGGARDARAARSISAASGRSASIELAELLVAANGGGGFAMHEFPAERRRIDIGDYYADDTLFRGMTGWRPRVAAGRRLDALARLISARTAQHYV